MWVCHNYVTPSQFKTYRQVDFARSSCPTVLENNPLISKDSEQACDNIDKAVDKAREFTLNYGRSFQVS